MNGRSSAIKNVRVNPKIIVFLSFFISVCVLFAISAFKKRADVMPDEVLFYDLAKSIYYGEELRVFNHAIGYHNLLYPLLLSPFFAIQDSVIRVYIISLFNCVIFSSSVFPLWLISKRFNNTKHTYYLLAINLVSQYILFCFSFMAELLFYPLLLWAFYLWLINNKKDNVWIAIAIGVYTYIMFLAKEIALVFIIAVVLFTLISPVLEYLMRDDKNNKLKSFFVKKKIICSLTSVVAFVIVYLIFKFTVFRNISNYYIDLWDHTSITAINSFGVFCYLIYGFIYVILGFSLSILFLPLLCPFFVYKKMNKKSKDLFLLSILFVILTAAMISYTITIREDIKLPDSVTPRPMLRYFASVSLCFYIVFFSNAYMFKSTSKKDFFKKSNVITILYLILFSFVYKGANGGFHVDGFVTFWYSSIESSLKSAFGGYDIQYMACIIPINLLICGVVLIVHYYDHNLKLFKNRLGFLSLTLATGLVTAIYGGYIERINYAAQPFEIREVISINKYFNSQQDCQILCLSKIWNIFTFDFYYDSIKNFTFETIEHFSGEISKIHKDKISVTKIPFACPFYELPYEGVDKIDYVLIHRDVQFEGFNFVDLDLVPEFSEYGYWHVYKNLNPAYLSFQYER